MPTRSQRAEGNTAQPVKARAAPIRRGRRPGHGRTYIVCSQSGGPVSARSRKGRTGRFRKPKGHTLRMDGHWQSDDRIVPANLPNNSTSVEAEAGEGRRSANGKADERSMSQTQGWNTGMTEVLERLRQAVRRERTDKLTALYH